MASANQRFNNLIAFSVLMAGEQILTKSPDYIQEKLNRYMGHNPPDAWQWGLDDNNRKIFNEYFNTWFKEDGDAEQKATT